MEVVGYIIFFFLLLLAILSIVGSFYHVKQFTSLTGGSLTGPQGNTGPAGAKGPAGVTGPTGTNGPPSNILTYLVNANSSTTGNYTCAGSIGLKVLNFDWENCYGGVSGQCPGMSSSNSPNPNNIITTYCINEEWKNSSGQTNQTMQTVINGQNNGANWLRYSDIGENGAWTNFENSYY